MGEHRDLEVALQVGVIDIAAEEAIRKLHCVQHPLGRIHLQAHHTTK